MRTSIPTLSLKSVSPGSAWARFPLLLFITMFIALPSLLQAQIDGTWNTTASGVWSDTDNWVTTPTSGTVPGGAGSTVLLTHNTGGFTAVTIDTTPRTVGVLSMGDSDGTADRHLAVSGGATLTLDNSGSDAIVNMIGRANSITTTVNLASDVNITNFGTGVATIWAFTASTAGLKTITNSGTGTAGVSIGRFDAFTTDGAGTVAIRQNSATSVLSLTANNGSGNSGFSGGLAIDAGKVRIGTTNSQGVGDVTMADGTALSATGVAGTTFFGSLLVVNGDVTLGDAVETRVLSMAGGITLTGDRTITTPSDILVSGTIGESGGSRSLTKDGAGILTFGKATAYTGSTIVNEGTLRLQTFNNLLSNTDITLNNGSVLDMGITSSGVDTVVVNSGTINGTKAGSQIFSNSYTVSSGAINADIGGGGTVPLTKTGSGTFTLSGVNLYTGTTTVTAGTLIVSGTGAINSTSGVNVTGGKFQYDSTTGLTRSVTINGGSFVHNSAVDYSGALTFTAGTLSGTNWEGSLDGLTIGSGQAISPGNSPGTAATGDQTWAGSGAYVWEINNATGTAGTDPGWDLLTGTGALTLTATGGDQFDINVTSLTLGNVAGDATNFSSISSYEWMIADFSSAISTFDASAFNIDTSGFSNAATGAFSIARGDSISGGDNTELYLVYTAIPEPATLGLLGLSLTVLVSFRRRRSM